MSQLTQQTSELIVDVLTIYHAGNARYLDYATEQVQNEAWGIQMRMKELKEQGVPGLEAVRRAKVEWLMRITAEQAQTSDAR